MDKKIRNLFSSEIGKRIYNNALRAIAAFSMEEKLRKGVLVGLSGGADSVMLLSFLLEYRRRTGDFKIAAVHVNHMIRGDEAVRDEEYSRSLAAELNVEFIAKSANVPKLSEEKGIGLEEAARIARYQIFEDIIQGRNDLSSIAVAHNSTDNLETVIFNMLRGSSSHGLSGIPPVRDNVIRPLIFIEKQDIIESLLKSGIAFVTDSTNDSSDYTRNYIRNEILQHFRKITPHPEISAERLSFSLRRDEDYLNTSANLALNACRKGEGITADSAKSLHPAILSRVIGIFAKEHGVTLENIHYSKICELIYRGGAFSADIPSRKTFISDGSVCRIINTEVFRESSQKKSYPLAELKLGVNEIFDKNALIILSLDKTPVISSNVYKISIQQAIRFDIINERLYVRARKDGDSFVAGGITRKLKKLFSDKKISQVMRDAYPVICDCNGIVLVPGFTVPDRARPESGESCLYVTYAVRDGR